MIAGYEHFLGLASRLQWDDASIDLSVDAGAFAAHPARDEVAVLVAGFCVGEAGVAEWLGPFADAATPGAAACFRAQEVDEERHARFYARVAREVVGHSAGSLRSLLPREFVALFEQRLPEAARAAAGDLPGAVGLYHMVLEGVVFTAGQLALLELLADDRLPGLRAGTELVLRDERWHVGFGTRCLQDAGVGSELEASILAEGERAAALWAPGQAERVVATLRRRLGAVRGQRATVH